MARKVLIFTSVLLLSGFFSLGQNQSLINTIRAKLDKATDKDSFELLNSLAWEYRWAYPDSTIYYAQHAYSIGQKLLLSKDLAKPLNYVGVAYNYKGDKLSAFDNYDRALKISLEQRDSLEIAYSNNNIGRLFFEQGLLSRSYEHFIKALSIFKKLKDQSGLAYTYQSLANLYKSQKDFSKSESGYLKAYRIRLTLGNTRDIMSALTQIGRLYQETAKHDKALRYFQLADSAGRVINDAINLAEIKTFAAESFLGSDKIAEAEAMCDQGLNYILENKNMRMLPQAYITMGQIQMRKNNLAAAKKYFKLSLGIAYQMRDMNSKMRAHYFLWKVSERDSSKAEQIKNQNQYLILKDSIKDLDLARQVERLQFEIEIQRKEQENELLKANDAKSSAIIRQQKIQNLGLIVAIILISAIGVGQWFNSKKKRAINHKLMLQNDEIQKQREEIVRQNEKLFKRNQQLSDLNHEKDTLMSIVAHDLKSPLHRIKGLTDLMEFEGETMNDEQRSYIRMSQDATQAGLDLITDLLDVHMLEENSEPNYTTFDMSEFLLAKTKEFEPAAEAKNIHMQITRVESEEVVLDVDYMGRILDNLLSNAIKFSNRDSVIDIAAIKLENFIEISIKDDGPGFSERDKAQLFQKFKKLSARPTAGETSNGLGLAIVKTLVDRLKGEIQLYSEQNMGSEFIIKLPISPFQ